MFFNEDLFIKAYGIIEPRWRTEKFLSSHGIAKLNSWCSLRFDKGKNYYVSPNQDYVIFRETVNSSGYTLYWQVPCDLIEKVLVLGFISEK